MKLIVGLGNPGDIYARSRHNIGFLVAKGLAKAYRISLKREKSAFSLSGKAKIEDNTTLVVAMPLTFMNLSGAAVGALLKKYAVKDLLVVCDDLDLEFGRLRIRPSGSAGGHRGLKSIIDFLGSNEFARLRIGIGRPGEKGEVSDYVLGNFNARERAQLKEVLERALACCQSWLTRGMNETMNIFNKRSRDNE